MQRDRLHRPPSILRGAATPVSSLQPEKIRSTRWPGPSVFRRISSAYKAHSPTRTTHLRGWACTTRPKSTPGTILLYYSVPVPSRRHILSPRSHCHGNNPVCCQGRKKCFVRVITSQPCRPTVCLVRGSFAPIDHSPQGEISSGVSRIICRATHNGGP